jgi:glycine/D-amino acid oxidase-like deaminating enzyme
MTPYRATEADEAKAPAGMAHFSMSPGVNQMREHFLRIRSHRLWEELEERQRRKTEERMKERCRLRGISFD